MKLLKQKAEDDGKLNEAVAKQKAEDDAKLHDAIEQLKAEYELKLNETIAQQKPEDTVELNEAATQQKPEDTVELNEAATQQKPEDTVELNEAAAQQKPEDTVELNEAATQQKPEDTVELNEAATQQKPEDTVELNEAAAQQKPEDTVELNEAATQQKPEDTVELNEAATQQKPEDTVELNEAATQQKPEDTVELNEAATQQKPEDTVELNEAAAQQKPEDTVELNKAAVATTDFQIQDVKKRTKMIESVLTLHERSSGTADVRYILSLENKVDDLAMRQQLKKNALSRLQDELAYMDISAEDNNLNDQIAIATDFIDDISIELERCQMELALEQSKLTSDTNVADQYSAILAALKAQQLPKVDIPISHSHQFDTSSKLAFEEHAEEAAPPPDPGVARRQSFNASSEMMQKSKQSNTSDIPLKTGPSQAQKPFKGDQLSLTNNEQKQLSDSRLEAIEQALLTYDNDEIQPDAYYIDSLENKINNLALQLKLRTSDTTESNQQNNHSSWHSEFVIKTMIALEKTKVELDIAKAKMLGNSDIIQQYKDESTTLLTANQSFQKNTDTTPKLHYLSKDKSSSTENNDSNNSIDAAEANNKYSTSKANRGGPTHLTAKQGAIKQNYRSTSTSEKSTQMTSEPKFKTDQEKLEFVKNQAENIDDNQIKAQDTYVPQQHLPKEQFEALEKTGQLNLEGFKKKMSFLSLIIRIVFGQIINKKAVVNVLEQALLEKYLVSSHKLHSSMMAKNSYVSLSEITSNDVKKQVEKQRQEGKIDEQQIKQVQENAETVLAIAQAKEQGDNNG